MQIRRGLYYTLPREATEGEFPVDPFLGASKLTPDAVIAFHSALWIHQVAYSSSNVIYYLTEQITRPRLQFQGKLYCPVHPSSQHFSAPNTILEQAVGVLSGFNVSKLSDAIRNRPGSPITECEYLFQLFYS